MAKRYLCDLSHFTFKVGDMGGLQTLACIPVVAGDGMEVNLEGVFRLAPLRRNLVVDCMVDLFCFYVPHRHIYGSAWTDFIKAGASESTTFTGTSTAARVSYLGQEYVSSEGIPLWVAGGYNRIWNRYFRSPTDGNTRADTYLTTNNNELLTGFKCGFLPVPWSTGVLTGVASSEREVASVTVMDIVALDRVKASYKTEVDREYFGQRYNDIMNVSFGTRINTDADERPTLCQHSSFWLSGYDVDGTDDIALGQYAGKSYGIGRMRMKRKFFAEHGALWVMCLLRFPTIHVNERPFLTTVVNPTYLEISGDPDLIPAEPPRVYNADEFFRSSSASSLGVMPYGQHYRYHPSNVHRSFELLDGFSFVDSQIDTIPEAHYIATDEYEEVFQTDALKQWQANIRLDVPTMRVVPPARRSLYAGV